MVCPRKTPLPRQHGWAPDLIGDCIARLTEWHRIRCEASQTEFTGNSPFSAQLESSSQGGVSLELLSCKTRWWGGFGGELQEGGTRGALSLEEADYRNCYIVGATCAIQEAAWLLGFLQENNAVFLYNKILLSLQVKFSPFPQIKETQQTRSHCICCWLC